MQRGFTLLEVMVVVVILAILAALVVPKIISRPDEARAAEAGASHTQLQYASTTPSSASAAKFARELVFFKEERC